MAENKKTVFVGLSGGVDSSVAALRLLKQGYNVVGVFIKVWHPDFLVCNWEQERLDAMRVAAKLGIPFLTCDAEAEYKNDVADYFIHEYTIGKTPNPDVMCNKYVKFGAFLRFAEEHNADFIATGHYAQVTQTNGKYELLRGIDTSKDQSYFLWTLTQEQLAKVLLPVGNSNKTEIRAEARKAGLLTASKKDSQGICFLGQVDIGEFLSHYVDLKEGAVLDTKGTEIGRHKGALIYTNGQRHGFVITKKDEHRKPYYVVSKNINNNTITVDTQKPVQSLKTTMTLREINLINYEPKIGDNIEVQTRYRQKPTTCTVSSVAVDELTVAFEQESDLISIGQSCVLYAGSKCCGGGIIA